MRNSGLSIGKERELAEFIATFYADPLGYVMAVYPWGMPTLPDGAPNPLANKIGPEDWQRDVLVELGKHIEENIARRELGMDMIVWRSAVGSGHGVGKSALVAWIISFLMSTRVDTRGAVTASTQFQLEDKTWPELSKWLNLALNKHWFRWTATTFSFAAYPEDKQKNYRTTAATVSETNTEAFAGLHNEGKTVFVVFDEASGVYPQIWKVADGALTDGEAFFFAFGNMTKPDGEFVDCFEKHAELYKLWNVDSRSVRLTNKNALEDIIKKHGIDSDEVRIRILGKAPRTHFDAFIPMEAVEASIKRDDWGDNGAALIMGVDGSRSPTGDKFRIFYRQGRDARSLPSLEFRGMNSIDAFRVVSREADRTRPDAIVVEGTGPTIGLIDLLRHRRYPVVEVYPGAPSSMTQKYYNNRAEWYDTLRSWLWEMGVLPEHCPNLTKELTSIKYGYNKHTQKMIMESKEDMAARGLPSPDEADSLMLTFATNVARRDTNRMHAATRQQLAKTEEDPLG